MTETDIASVPEAPGFTLDDLAGFVEDGGFSVMESDEAFSAIANAAPGPDPAVSDAVRSALTGMYVETAFPRWVEAAQAAGDDMRAWRAAGADPAIAGTTGAPYGAYGLAEEAAAAGDPSLKASIRSAFLNSL